jgi:hypothetical protein
MDRRACCPYWQSWRIPIALQQASAAPGKVTPNSTPGGPGHWRRVLGIALGTVVVLAAIGGGAMYWLGSRNHESTDDAFVDGYTTQIVVGIVLLTLLSIDIAWMAVWLLKSFVAMQ